MNQILKKKLNDYGFCIIKGVNFENYYFEKVKQNIENNIYLRENGTRFVYANNDDLSYFYKNFNILNIAENFFNTKDLSLYFARLLLKDCNSNHNVTPHQDVAYFHGNPNKLSFFIFPDGNSIDRGGLSFVPGSHSFGILPKGNIPVKKFELDSICPVLTNSDILISNFSTWHWSNNLNDKKFKRLIIQIVIQESSCGSFNDKYQNQPILLSGKWNTKNFFSYSDCLPESYDNTPEKQKSEFKNSECFEVGFNNIN